MMKMSTLLVAVAGVATAVVMTAQGTGPQAGAPAAPALTSAALVQRAAAAIGGADRLRAVRNITLNGYGQYAYQFGGGRITGEPGAPEKYIAANELKRVYDLEHGRFQLVERRNMLFPFLAPFGHSWAPVNQVLDGDVAYDQQGGKTIRVARESDGALQVDGVHVRRMLMLTNPAVLVRTLLDPATRVSTPRRQGGLDVVNITLKEGDTLSAAFAPSGRPAWIRWSTRHTNTGQMNFTTTFTGWADATGNSGLLLPLAYETRISYRNVDFLKVYVDAYQVDTAIADLAAPAAVRSTPEPPSYPVPTITSQRIGNGVWRVDQGGTTVIEFRDKVVIFELNVNVATARAILAHARTLAPGKPVTHYITTHNHFDHTAGLRQAVAEGLIVVQRRSSEPQFREMAAHAAPDFQDDLARSPKPFKFLAVDEHYQITDGTQTLDLYWVPNNGHMADVLVGYIASERLLMEGDLVTAAFDWQHWPDGFRDVVEKHKLTVERISPVHPTGLVQGQPTLTRAQAEELLKGGTERARQHCAAEQAKGNYHPGCPVQSKYY
jgi:glyoxylase-like metal-dependent hydrolase (beta-lactamase superfamily II)